jgi:aspartyl-tRNA(Asn)/glutamyl-tRNA(Gln) amidotransferase subunit A
VERRTFITLTGAAAASLAFDPALAQTQSLADLSIADASDLLRRKMVSPVDLTQACLTRIERHNPSLNAYITVRGDEALAEARAVEDDLRRGRSRGPLHGIPIALKDNIDTAGVRTTGASALFKDRVPAEDAEVTRRLKNAGIILLGKLNLHEFAYGGSSTITAFGTMHNPWALDHVTGGSSGGPGIAVVAGLCYGSIGTDTAGSVRMPAAHCGIVGFKPTYGRVPSRGVMTLSWTLDHVGPMVKTVEDAALMLNAVAGYDEMDPTTVDVPVPDYLRSLKASTQRLRLGIPRAGFFDNLDPEVESAINAALAILRKMTASTTDVTLPPSGNPARVWAPEAYAYHEKWITESPDKYQPATRGTLQRSADSKAWEYVQARRQVELARREIRKTFANVDLLVTPTMKTPPPLLNAQGAGGGGGNNNAVFDVFGLPTISIPCGFTKSGLPIGIQISGAPFAESTVLSLAYAYEQATDWHTRRPHLA